MVNAPSVSLKVIFVVHLLLTTWAGMVLGASYVYVNAFVLAFGLWAILMADNSEAVLMCFITNLTAIITDIVMLGIGGEGLFGSEATSAAKFSGAMAIINLLLRPVSSFIMYRLYQDRTGQYSDFGIPGVPGFGAGGSPRTGGYENIDQPVPSNNVETASPHSSIDKSPVP